MEFVFCVTLVIEKFFQEGSAVVVVFHLVCVEVDNWVIGPVLLFSTVFVVLTVLATQSFEYFLHVFVFGDQTDIFDELLELVVMHQPVLQKLFVFLLHYLADFVVRAYFTQPRPVRIRVYLLVEQDVGATGLSAF